METVFTPISSFGGGLAIGLGAVILMLSLGRILGTTGILLDTIFAQDRGEFKCRIAMIIGMITAPISIFFFTGKMPEVNVPIRPFMIVFGGMVIGFGASLGSGCGSGHWVCGLSRFCLCSLVAVPIFMATGVITLYIIRQVLGV